MPILLDVDFAAGATYQAVPDRLYIVGREGRIAYRGAPGPVGFRPADVEAWLRTNT